MRVETANVELKAPLQLDDAILTSYDRDLAWLVSERQNDNFMVLLSLKVIVINQLVREQDRINDETVTKTVILSTHLCIVENC